LIVVSITPNCITVEGHAGYAEPGRDIVCAAVSGLIHNLVQSIESLTEDSVKFNIRPGYAEIVYKDLSVEGRLLIDSFFIGVSDIVAAYAEYVQII